MAHFWIVGDTPLIVHAWSEKAKREMLAKQVKATRIAREARDPESDFKSSLYEMTPGVYGFPVTGIKNCLLASAHKDKGIARTAVMASSSQSGFCWVTARYDASGMRRFVHSMRA